MKRKIRGIIRNISKTLIETFKEPIKDLHRKSKISRFYYKIKKIKTHLLEIQH